MSARARRLLVGIALGVAGLGLAGLIVLLVVLISGLQQVDQRTAALQDAVAGGTDAPIQGTVDDVERRLRGLRSGEDASIARVVEGLVTVTDRLDAVSRRLGDVAGDTEALSAVAADLAAVRRNTKALSAVAADLGAVRRNTRTIGDLEGRLAQVVVQLDRLQRRLGALGPIRRSLEQVERDVDRIERSIPGPVAPAGD